MLKSVRLQVEVVQPMIPFFFLAELHSSIMERLFIDIDHSKEKTPWLKRSRDSFRGFVHIIHPLQTKEDDHDVISLFFLKVALQVRLFKR